MTAGRKILEVIAAVAALSSFAALERSVTPGVVASQSAPTDAVPASGAGVTGSVKADLQDYADATHLALVPANDFVVGLAPPEFRRVAFVASPHREPAARFIPLWYDQGDIRRFPTR